MAKQISVFVDNKPGRIRDISEVLYKANINMRALTIQDRGESGLVNVLVNDPQAAYLALNEKGFACALTDIIAVVLKDEPGGFYFLAEVLAEKDINIVDASGFVIESNQKAVFCAQVKELAKAMQVLKEKDFVFLSEQELYGI